MKNTFIIIGMLLLCAVSAQAVKVYPNPWIPDSTKTDSVYGYKVHGTFEEGIYFDELNNSGGTIYIYNTTGDLVRKVLWSEGQTKTSWDGRNERSEYVASGVYIWVIKEGGSKTGKILVVR